MLLKLFLNPTAWSGVKMSTQRPLKYVCGPGQNKDQGDPISVAVDVMWSDRPYPTLTLSKGHEH